MKLKSLSKERLLWQKTYDKTWPTGPMTQWSTVLQPLSSFGFSDDVWPTLWMSGFFWLHPISAEIFLQRGFSWLFYFRTSCIYYLSTLPISSVALFTNYKLLLIYLCGVFLFVCFFMICLMRARIMLDLFSVEYSNKYASNEWMNEQNPFISLF